MFAGVNEIIDRIKCYGLRIDLRGQADLLRRQLEDSLVKKVRFTGSKELILFAQSELKIVDIVDPFLEFQAMRLQALLSKIQPCDYEALNGQRVHPLRIAGILSTK